MRIQLLCTVYFSRLKYSQVQSKMICFLEGMWNYNDNETDQYNNIFGHLFVIKCHDNNYVCMYEVTRILHASYNCHLIQCRVCDSKPKVDSYFPGQYCCWYIEHAITTCMQLENDKCTEERKTLSSTKP